LPDGRSHLDRTTLRLLPSGDVRQMIETSTDEGQSRASGFDAAYRIRQVEHSYLSRSYYRIEKRGQCRILP